MLSRLGNVHYYSLKLLPNPFVLTQNYGSLWQVSICCLTGKKRLLNVYFIFLLMFVFRVDSIDSLTLVSTQILKLHMSCVKGLHHHVPILFDYYHFAVIDTTIHATVTALGLPNNRCVNDVRFDIFYLWWWWLRWPGWLWQWFQNNVNRMRPKRSPTF